MPMQYTEIFKVVKNENFCRIFFIYFLIFAQNIDCGYMLDPPRLAGKAVLTSTHTLCFAAKIRTIGIPCKPQLVGFKGVNISQTFS